MNGEKVTADILEQNLPSDPGILLLGTDPKEMKSAYEKRCLHSHVDCSPIHKINQYRIVSISVWIKKIGVCIQPQEKDEFLTFATTGMKLDNMLSGKKSDNTETQVLHSLSLVEVNSVKNIYMSYC